MYRRANYKSVLTKDSVKDALDKGEYINKNDKLWLTSTKETFRGRYCPIEREEKTEHSRDKTNFVLGFDESRRYLTTATDYRPHTSLSSPSRIHVDNTTNIPDFSSQYNKDLKLEKSEYQNQFDELTRNTIRPPMRSLKERQQYTNDLRSTHFQLGSCETKTGTETQHSFIDFKNSCIDDDLKRGALETYKSRVFREGDWNQTNRHMLKKSITQNDFVTKDATSCRLPTQKSYQQRTHFSLGSDTNKTASSYDKDYGLAQANFSDQSINGSLYVPCDAEIFPKNDENHFITTHDNNFKAKDKELTLQIKRERICDLNKNIERHSLRSVPFCTTDDISSSSIPRKLMSMNKSAYQVQYPTLCDKVASPNSPTYNHTKGDYNETIRSEFQDSFSAHDQRATEIRNECMLRRKDNKSTHFVFGTRDCGEFQNTEQASQYSKHVPLDPTLLAAGKSLPFTKSYSHIFSCGDGESHSEGLQQSIMKNDYRLMDTERSLQVPNRCNMSRDKEVVMDTHFFHLDDEYKGCLQSTTQTHFITPPRNSFDKQPLDV